MFPEILLHPNIPKPLHGINPRTIMGQEWWDIEREKAYSKYDYECWACGVGKSRAKYHRWLEAHEIYDFDYKNGTLTFKELCALCHSCHNYIHNGRLKVLYYRGQIEREKFVDILQHGTNILISNKLPVNFFAYNVMKETNVKLPKNVKVQLLDSGNVSWSDWKLIFEGKAYKSNFRNIYEWQEYYRHYEERT